MSPAIAILFLLVIAAVTYFSNKTTISSLEALTAHHLPAVDAAQRLRIHVASVEALVMRSLAYEGAGMKARQIEAIDKQLAQEFQTLKTDVARLKAASAGERAQRYAEVEKALENFLRISGETLDMKSGGLSSAAMVMNTGYRDTLRLNKLLDELVAEVEQDSRDQSAKVMETVHQASAAALAALLMAMGLSLAATGWCTRLITRPLSRAVDIARDVAQGNLSRRAEGAGGDATGQVLAALNGVTLKLSGMMTDIRRVAEQIDMASHEIAAGNRDLSNRTEQTVSSLQVTAATVEQLSTQMQHNSANALHANELAAQAAAVAREGGAVVGEVVQAMNDINDQSKRIGDIITVIDGIAFQTNILSLNAAVEAARAGDQGRGFAVVAHEVRALATRSADAAREIRHLITASAQQAGIGATKVQTAGQIMRRVVDSIQEVADLVSEIARANKEQATGVAGVNEAISRMDHNTQQNAALVEQAAAATATLQRQAEQLMASVSVFRTA